MNLKKIKNLDCEASLDTIPDVQNSPDTRHIVIDRVGVKGVRYPVTIATQSSPLTTIGTWSMFVRLPEQKKGTHMSRFIALLEEFTCSNSPPLTIDIFSDLLRDMVNLLDAQSGVLELSFPFFLKKKAPISQVESLMNYEVGLIGEITEKNLKITQKVTVPVTSLCPCSKEISSYGAHNQRSHITVIAQVNKPIAIEELINIIEQQSSCELFGLLKRPDEKYVTEHAYDNPKFVEDLVRDVAKILNLDSRINAYELSAENFESIHNHSAFAYISHTK